VARRRVPLASLLVAEAGTWHLVFLMAAVFNALASASAIVFARPLRLGLTARAQPAVAR